MLKLFSVAAQTSNESSLQRIEERKQKIEPKEKSLGLISHGASQTAAILNIN